jgi:hypothetical protein
MLELLRKHQYGIMLVVAIFTIFAFAFLPNRANDPSLLGGGVVVNGKTYDSRDVGSIRDGLQFASSITKDYMKIYGISSMAPTMGNTSTGGSHPMDSIVNIIILREEAKKLGVEVTDAEVDDYIKTLKDYQTNGEFDPAKWTDAMDQLTVRGDVEDKEREKDKGSVRRSILYSGLRDLVLFDKVATLMEIHMPPTEPQVDWEYWKSNQETMVMSVTFKDEDYQDVEVPDTEIQEYYDKNKESDELMTKEKRALRYVKLALPLQPVRPDTATMTPELREASNSLFDEETKAFEDQKKIINPIASRLSEWMVADDREESETFEVLLTRAYEAGRAKFDEEHGAETHDLDAEEEETPSEEIEAEGGDGEDDPVPPEKPKSAFPEQPKIETTELFVRSDPPEGIAGATELLNAAFGRKIIGEESKIGDAVVSSSGFYFYEITEIAEPAEQPQEEVRDLIVDKLKAAKASDLLTTALTEFTEKINSASAEGKEFMAAAEAAGHTVKEYPPFSSTNPIVDDVDARTIMDAASGRPASPQIGQPGVPPVNTGSLSEPQDILGGKVIIHVVRREIPEDPEKVAAKKEPIRKSLGNRDGSSHYNRGFLSWFTARKSAAFNPLDMPATGAPGS